MLEAIKQEMNMRKQFLANEAVNTLYFGGGTPSLLETAEIAGILNEAGKYFNVDPNPEITLEGNPDDLTATKLRELKTIGINRLSIGVQSFHNPTLKYLHRIHDSTTATRSVSDALKSGFSNINIDLIFGIMPGYFTILKNDLDQIKSFEIKHISTYCLTIEPGTVFGNWHHKGKIEIAAEEDAASQYEYIIDDLNGKGFEHYEISNFAKPGYESRHNTSYWQNEKYLGIGPGAHSYDQINRYYNISNNSMYIKSLSENIIPETIDYLSDRDRINEYIMTSIRTRWGCDINYISSKFGVKFNSKTLSYIEDLERNKYIVKSGNLIQLTKKGKLIADKIASEMFFP